MVNNYRIKVRVEIEECTDRITDGPRQENVGEFAWVISAEQATSIDVCEQRMLQTTYEALRDTVAHHLSAVSRRYVLGVGGSLEACQVKPYRVDGEIGRIIFEVYWLEPAENEGDIARAPFPVLHAQEWYRTSGFKEMALVYGASEESYRQASELLNRLRHQEQATPFRTLRENTEREGQQVLAALEHQAGAILQEHGFTEAGLPTPEADDYSQQVLVTLAAGPVAQAISACAPAADWIEEMAVNPVAYEDPTPSTRVSVDDVNVKRQKASRKGTPQPEQEHKYVHNTIAHIVHAGATYVINGAGMVQVLRLVLAFLLHNHLLHQNLIFFVDGQRTLYTAILGAFAWLPALQVILDWFHLEKRCKEQLSLALKGRVSRNTVLDQLRPCLWHGCLDRAITLLRTLAPDQIKNQEPLDKLIEYLERNRPHIPCYAVRKHLGWCNSSNRGEKTNDLVVSDRQKHNGMSWSKPGSVALTTISVLVRNQEYQQWFKSGTLSFSFSPTG